MRLGLAAGISILVLSVGSPRPGSAEILSVLSFQDGRLRFFEGDKGRILGRGAHAGQSPRVMFPLPELFRLYVSQDANGPRDSGLIWFGSLTGSQESLLALPGCKGPAGLAQGAEQTFWLACERSPVLLQLPLNASMIRRRLRVEKGVSEVAYHQTTELLLLLKRAGELQLVDPSDGEVIRRFPFKGTIHGLNIGHEGTLATVLADSEGSLYLFDPDAELLSQPIAVGDRPASVHFVPHRPMVVVTNGQGELLLIDLEVERVMRRLDLGSRGSGLVVNPSGSTIWVALPEKNVVARVDVDQWTVTNRFEIPNGPTQLVLVKD